MKKVLPLLTVSIVSHGQGAVLRPLLEQLARLGERMPIQIVVTLNLPGDSIRGTHFPSLDIEYIENPSPKGFGANHNAVFQRCRTPYFCVINPDVRIEGEPFSELIARLKSHPGVAGPIVRDPNGHIEDSARRVPSIARLLWRVLSRRRYPDYSADRTRQVDWLAGMCLLFDYEAYRQLNGFDERYYLYCEDVDICLRARLHGYSVSWVAKASIIHDAQRASRRRLRFLAWHVASMRRLLFSEAYKGFRLQIGKQVDQF